MLIDEFTSVVDRQVAKIGAHAAQKYVRKAKRRLIVATCHFDVIEWLQPDWVFEPATVDFAWGWERPRPQLECAIRRVHRDRWKRYAPFHYLTTDLTHTAACYELTVDGTPAAFNAVIHRPQPQVRNLKGISRLVCLPDWQGLGLGPALSEHVAAAYTALGFRRALGTRPSASDPGSRQVADVGPDPPWRYGLELPAEGRLARRAARTLKAGRPADGDIPLRRPRDGARAGASAGAHRTGGAGATSPSTDWESPHQSGLDRPSGRPESPSQTLLLDSEPNPIQRASPGVETPERPPQLGQ